MDNLFIEAFKSEDFENPQLEFNIRTGKCSIVGKSIMQDAGKFYSPLINSFEEFSNSSSSQNLKLLINLDAIDSSSEQALFDFMFVIRNCSDAGCNIEITWKIPGNNVEIESFAMDVMSETGLSIEIIYK